MVITKKDLEFKGKKKEVYQHFQEEHCKKKGN